MCHEGEEGGDVGEHTGQDEGVFGLIAEHSLQELNTLVDGQLLHEARQGGNRGGQAFSGPAQPCDPRCNHFWSTSSRQNGYPLLKEETLKGNIEAHRIEKTICTTKH